MLKTFENAGWGGRSVAQSCLHHGRIHANFCSFLRSSGSFETGKSAALVKYSQRFCKLRKRNVRIKGKGVKFMENRAEWHGKPPTKEEMVRALVELGDGKDER